MAINRFTLKFLVIYLLLSPLPVPAIAKMLVGVVMSGYAPFFSKMHKTIFVVLRAGLPYCVDFQVTTQIEQQAR